MSPYYYCALELKSMENYSNPIHAGILTAQTLQEKMFVFTQPGKKPQPTEVLVEDKGNMDYVVGETLAHCL